MPETREHIRALADLYLTGEGERPTAAPPATAAAGRATVELILVGHLPVRAGLWLTQYADDVARDEGPTALLRLDTDQVVLEILRGADSAARASAASTLEEAITTAGGEVRHWIVRPGIDERLASMLEAAPDVITILSGADEAAVVAAYRTIKELHDAALRLNATLPAIELSILGADPVAAQRATDSISETAELHLGIKPAIRRCVRAMGSLGSTLHFRFPSDHAAPLPILISTLLAAGRRAAPDEMSQRRPRELSIDIEPLSALPAPPMAGDVPEVGGAADSPPRRRVQSLATPIGQPAFAVREPWAQTPGEQDRSPATAGSGNTVHSNDEPMRLRPKIEVQVEPKQVAPRPAARPAPPARALATWMDGLALLPIRCPDAPEVEIAVDAGGGFHLIAWSDRLRALATVGAWLRKHRDLVAMACTDHLINGAERIESHLVTSEPRQVADLFSTDLHLHLLAPVEVDGKAGWYSAVLNR